MCKFGEGWHTNAPISLTKFILVGPIEQLDGVIKAKWLIFQRQVGLYLGQAADVAGNHGFSAGAEYSLHLALTELVSQFGLLDIVRSG